MNVKIVLSHKSLVNTRVIIKMGIYSQWKTRREWQKVFGVKSANRHHNNDIKDAIRAYRDICNYKIIL
jgi:hypothetical protein